MKRIFSIVSVLVASAAVFSACAFLQGGCTQEAVDAYGQEVTALIAEWDGVVDRLDTATPQEAAGELGTLESIRDRTGQVEVPECLAEAHPFLETFMDEGAQAYTAYANGEPESAFNAHYDLAIAARDQFSAALDSFGE